VSFGLASGKTGARRGVLETRLALPRGLGEQSERQRAVGQVGDS
jgi:hypothetical protein